MQPRKNTRSRVNVLYVIQIYTILRPIQSTKIEYTEFQKQIIIELRGCLAMATIISNSN